MPDPAKIVVLSPDELAAIVRAAVAEVQGGQAQGDHLVTAQEAAKILAVSADWVYRHAETLPFTKRVGEGSLRFSYQGIQRWLKTR